jgi:glutamate/tyrosine decarboxylase-like PLP-dependent enzyme
MCLKEHGTDKYGRLIEQNIQQANFLTNLVKKQNNLELLAPTTMNIVNFRYNDGKMENTTLNKLNEEVLLQLQEKGIAAPSSTTLNKNFSIRVAISNHRSKQEDFNLLISEIMSIVDSIDIKLISKT